MLPRKGNNADFTTRLLTVGSTLMLVAVPNNRRYTYQNIFRASLGRKYILTFEDIKKGCSPVHRGAFGGLSWLERSIDTFRVLRPKSHLVGLLGKVLL